MEKSLSLRLLRDRVLAGAGELRRGPLKRTNEYAAVLRAYVELAHALGLLPDAAVRPAADYIAAAGALRHNKGDERRTNEELTAWWAFDAYLLGEA